MSKNFFRSENFVGLRKACLIGASQDGHEFIRADQETPIGSADRGEDELTQADSNTSIARTDREGHEFTRADETLVLNAALAAEGFFAKTSRTSLRQVMTGARIGIVIMTLAVAVLAQAPDQKQDPNIPDAPSAVQPPKPVPEPAPPPEPAAPDQTPVAPATNEPPPESAAPDTSPNPVRKPPINIRTVPEGGATQDSEGLYKLPPVYINQVMVPVTVKDESGRLMNGLLAKDFNVLENGKKQKLNFFTSDPFALSAAVIIDLGMKDVDVQRVNHTFPALEGVFSQFDEVSIYSYSNAVSQQANWQAMNQKLSDTFASLAQARGRNNGPPVTSGPLGPQGPTINNMPADPAAPIVYTPTQESHVMNDAILKAALDLSKRDKTRRKVIFVISDGREYRSDASYKDVLRVLLSNNIMVYAVGVGGSAIPVYNKIEKLHIPRFGYSDILPKYANATGGEVSNQLTHGGIEDAYTKLIGDARNQYTLGYLTHEPAIGGYRSIEVLVDRPSCRRSSIRPCVDLTAKDGYYPAPPAR
jgi:VWFA-related protein